jgi:hypothetical protein
MSTTSTIEEMIETTMGQIGEAAGKRDLAMVEALTRKAAELEGMKRTVLGIEDKLKGLNGTVSVTERTPARELPVEVTQGMINQNLLTLTPHVKRGRIRTGEDLTIQAHPHGERFRTQVLMNGNKLQERGAIGRFYREAGVKAGDFVVLAETGQGRWALKKAAPGQYRSRRSVLASL